MASVPPSESATSPVIQRFKALLPLALAQLGGVRDPEERGREFGEPLGVDSGHLAHVLLGGEHELVVDDPLRLPVEERARRMDVHHLPVHHRLVAFLRVFPGRVTEETAGDGFLDARGLLST